MPGVKRTICVDFDGVIHSYTSGWTWGTGDAQAVPDLPVKHAFAWLEEMTRHFDVCIYSSRSQVKGGVAAMQQWFRAHGLKASVLTLIRFPEKKPAAHVYIDDRAWLFTGPESFPTVNQLLAFKPWNK